MIACPICGLTLQATGVNPNIFQCQRKKEWVPELQVSLPVIHATYYVDPLTQEVTYRVIETAGYSFTITDDHREKSTVIRKVKALPRKRGEARTFESVEILKIQAAVDLPWNNRDQVIERIKLYLLFS